MSNQIEVSTEAKAVAEALVKPAGPRKPSAWKLDEDVQASVDALYLALDRKAPKRQIINALLRVALRGAKHVTEAQSPRQ